MQRTVNEADHTLVVLSPDALRSDYVEAEWQAAFRDDPLGRRRRLIPVRVAPLERPGLLGGYTWIDLVGMSEDPARAALLSGVRAAHTDGVRPAQQPAYPGGSHPGGSHPGGVEIRAAVAGGDRAGRPGRNDLRPVCRTGTRTV